MEPAAADKCWEHPKEGDQIALISPSSAPSSTATAKAVYLLSEEKFAPTVSDGMISAQPFNRSNTVEYRTADFLKALRSPASVIWCLRGGRGASEIFMNSSAFDEFREVAPKLLIGFSDFTVFHLWANSMGWPSLHGIVLSFCQ